VAVPADPNKVTAATIVARLADLFKAIDALFTDKAIADVITLIKKVGIVRAPSPPAATPCRPACRASATSSKLLKSRSIRPRHSPA
jgi:hypothetical protein